MQPLHRPKGSRHEPWCHSRGLEAQISAGADDRAPALRAGPRRQVLEERLPAPLQLNALLPERQKRVSFRASTSFEAGLCFGEPLPLPWPLLGVLWL